VLENPTDTAAAKRALVRTYNPPAYADPWDCVEDFERVQQAAAKHPNKGSAALASVVELPRGRIRPWLDGARPDCYRGLQTALSNGWLLENWDCRGRALNCLAAWLLSSGSIDRHSVATWIADTDAERQALEHYADAAGIRLVRTREDDDRPDEYRPDADASVLGRVLSTWTGLQGDKDRTVRFPRYVRFAPEEVARDFCRVYVAQRGTDGGDDAQRRRPFRQIMAIRSEAFREDLLGQLRRVVDEPGAVRGDSWPVRIYEPAKSELAGYPDLDE
jgi:hypothetical protein